MGLNLGLECLADEVKCSDKVLSYEYLDAVIMYNEACDNLTLVADRFDTIVQAAENLESICDVVKQHGVTPALEALVGGNFQGGLSLEAAEGAKTGVWESIKNFCIKVWQAIKEFFLHYFTTLKGIRSRLLEFREAAGKPGAKLIAKPFSGLKAEVLTEIGRSTANLEKKIDPEGIKKYGDPAGEVSFGENLADAKKYADVLLGVLSDYDKRKDAYIKMCDSAIEVAKNSEKMTKEQQQEEIAKAKGAKEVVNKAFKAVYSSAAAFLAHVKVEAAEAAKKDEPKAEDDKKADGKEGKK